MKLLYITVRMPFGTGEEFLVTEVRELLRAGHTVLIIPRSPPRAIFNRDAAELAGYCERAPLLCFRIIVRALIEGVTHPLACLKIAAFLAASKNLTTLLKNLLVVPKGLWVGHLAKTWGAAHIHAHWATTTATVAMIASEVSGIAWSFTAHRGDIATNNLLALKIATSAFVRFISTSGLRMATSLGSSTATTKGLVIQMGVDIPDAPRIAETASNTVLCPASLIPVKGHQFLIHAMALLKQRKVDCCLHIAGDGPLRRQLEQMAKELGVSDVVRFLGAVPHNEIVTALRNHDVSAVVLPSIDLGKNLHEGIPVSLMEAMACAVPVVSTCTGGIPELLSGGAGIMVPPKDPIALANAIQGLLSDPVLRREQGIQGLKRVRERFSSKATVAQLVARIESAVQTGG